MPDYLRKIRLNLRRLVRSSGWDVVRYHPVWPTLLGVERLPVRTVLDIGAYDGDTARALRHYFPQANLYCFEPQPQPFQALAAWAAGQKGRVQAQQLALTDESKTMDLLVYPDAPRKASLARSTPAWLARHSAPVSLPVNCRRLDDVAATMNLEEDIVVKIDTEGTERQVILGGANLIRRAAACIVEVNLAHRFAEENPLAELLDLLASLGLEYAGNIHQGTRSKLGTVIIDALFINKMTIHRQEGRR